MVNSLCWRMSAVHAYLHVLPAIDLDLDPPFLVKIAVCGGKP
jgi:hypothetical protein